MADLDAVGNGGNATGEIVIDAFLHQQARRRGAALAIQRIDHEGCGIDGTVEIGIVENDDRVFAAEFEVNPLQRRRPLGHDHRAGAAFADKGDRLDVGMLRQRLSGVLAETVDEVEDALREPGLFGDLDQKLGRHRREFGRFVNHGAARGQRRRDLPCRQHERRIPRGDHAHRANRTAGGCVQLPGASEGLAVLCFRRLVGEEPKVLGAAQGGFGHEADSLAGVHAFGEGDFLRARLDRVGNGMKDFATFGARHVAPGRKGRLGCGNGGIDVG